MARDAQQAAPADAGLVASLLNRRRLILVVRRRRLPRNGTLMELSMKLLYATPALPVRDMERSAAFYRDQARIRVGLPKGGFCETTTRRVGDSSLERQRR